jgi:hypothetical protein
MKRSIRVAGLAMIMASGLMAAHAAADEANSRPATKSAIPASSLSPAALDRDPLVQGSQADALSERVDALETSKAAVDQKTKSPISLSISAWVTQQATYTRH